MKRKIDPVVERKVLGLRHRGFSCVFRTNVTADSGRT